MALRDFKSLASASSATQADWIQKLSDRRSEPVPSVYQKFPQTIWVDQHTSVPARRFPTLQSLVQGRGSGHCPTIARVRIIPLDQDQKDKKTDRSEGEINAQENG